MLSKSSGLLLSTGRAITKAARVNTRQQKYQVSVSGGLPSRIRSMTKLAEMGTKALGCSSWA